VGIPVSTTNFQPPHDPSPGSTSLSLIARVKARDPAAWKQLVEIYAPLTYFWCRKSGVSAEDSRDVVQDVFSSMWKAIDGFRPDRKSGSFRGWLCTITRSKVADHWRRCAGHPNAIGGTDAHRQFQQLQELDPSTSPGDLSSSIERSGVLHRAVQIVRNDFEAKTWQLFSRVVLDGESIATVADEFSVSSAAVRQAKSRVLRRLRVELKSLEDT